MIYVNYKEKVSNFASGETWQTPLSQVITVNITSPRTPTHQVSRWKAQKHSITCVIFLPKGQTPALNMRKHRTNPSGRTFYKITGL